MLKATTYLKDNYELLNKYRWKETSINFFSHESYQALTKLRPHSIMLTIWLLNNKMLTARLKKKMVCSNYHSLFLIGVAVLTI